MWLRRLAVLIATVLIFPIMKRLRRFLGGCAPPSVQPECSTDDKERPESTVVEETGSIDSAAETTTSTSLLLRALPHELLIKVVASLKHGPLSRFEQACAATHNLETSRLWRRLTQDVLRTKSAQFSQNETSDTACKTRFAQLYKEHHRRSISREELQASSNYNASVEGGATLRWLFNFTPNAGGGSLHSIQEVTFSTDGHLHMRGYPPLPCALVDHTCSKYTPHCCI